MQPGSSALARLLPRVASPASAAALALAALALAAAAPAHAAAPDVIRYASVKACTLKNGAQVPCGAWRLSMRGGRTIDLPDARVAPRDAAGKVRGEQPAPIAVSGDGTTVAYFRRSDDRLVVRRLGGPARVMKNAVAKGVGMDDIALYLSRRGDRLAVETGDEGSRRPTLVYEVSAGADPGEIPGTLAFQGFGGDGESVLAAGLTGDNITRLGSFSADGEREAAAKPPRTVADNAPYGLASDGTTVAFFSGSGAKVSLRRYDLASGGIARGIPVRLTGTDLPEVVTWSGDTRVTAHISRPAKGGRTAIRVLEIDVESGDVRTLDSYTVRGDAFAYAPRGA